MEKRNRGGGQSVSIGFFSLRKKDETRRDETRQPRARREKAKGRAGWMENIYTDDGAARPEDGKREEKIKKGTKWTEKSREKKYLEDCMR